MSKRTEELEKENARPKRPLAEKQLAINILHEVAVGKFSALKPRCRAVRVALEKFRTSERFACEVSG